MAYVSRDVFARWELHKTRERGASCAWCGRHDATDDHEVVAGYTDAIPSVEVRAVCPAVHGRVYRFRVETDGGRVSIDRETFCSKSCRESFYA